MPQKMKFLDTREAHEGAMIEWNNCKRKMKKKHALSFFTDIVAWLVGAPLMDGYRNIIYIALERGISVSGTRWLIIFKSQLGKLQDFPSISNDWNSWSSYRKLKCNFFQTLSGRAHAKFSYSETTTLKYPVLDQNSKWPQHFWQKYPIQRWKVPWNFHSHPKWLLSQM